MNDDFDDDESEELMAAEAIAHIDYLLSQQTLAGVVVGFVRRFGFVPGGG